MEKLLLDGEWELHYAPEHAGKTTAQAVKEDPAYTHIEANVPGNAELDLYAAGKAPEPFGGTNLYAFRPYEFYEWWYMRAFVAPQALAERGAVLCLDGVDTFSTVYLNGTAIATMPTAEVARQMALLPQSPQAPAGLTVGELVALGRYPHQRGFGRLTDDDRRIIDWALSITHLDGLAERPLDALSGGQRQRAWIAMALAQDTGLILLDEPTTYLDMAHQLEVLELLQTLNRDEGKTIALVIHELNLAARFSDWMIALKSGAIRGAGTPKEVMTPALLREVFGLDALIEPDPWTGRPSLVSYRLAGEEH